MTGTTTTPTNRRNHTRLDAHAIQRTCESLENRVAVISFGFADGKALVVPDQVQDLGPKMVRPKDKSAQIVLLEKAFDSAIKKLKESHEQAEKSDQKKAEMLEHQIGMLEGKELKSMMLQVVDTWKASAAHAIETVIDSECRKIAENPMLQRYTGDFRELQQHLLMGLNGQQAVSLKTLSEPRVVVIANPTVEDITTADTPNILGWVVGAGNSAAHVRLLLKDAEVPVVSANIEGIKDGDRILINSLTEKLIIRPNDEEVTVLQQTRESITGGDASTPLSRHAPITRDGQSITILGTLNMPKGVKAITNQRLTGVGLWRSEFLFSGKARRDWPDEDAQKKEMVKVLGAMSPGFATIRTADLGADKWEPGFGAIPGGDGSKLGVRGIRLCLADEEFFLPHLRAIIRAQAEVGNAYIMFPMINDLSEFRLAKQILIDQANDLVEQGVIPVLPKLRVGAMIETAAAAIGADKILKEADFLSIGASDFIQYTLAADRDVAAVEHSFLPHHPAVLRLMKQVVDAAKEADKPISICGDMPSRRTYLPALLGLGLNKLTISSAAIPRINAKISILHTGECRELAEAMMQADSPEESGEMLMGFHRKLPPVD